MQEYGWHLEDFNEVYNRHYDNIDSWYEYISSENYCINMQDISQQKFTDMIDFMSDFLRAIDDIDFLENKSKGVIDEE